MLYTWQPPDIKWPNAETTTAVYNSDPGLFTTVTCLIIIGEDGYVIGSGTLRNLIHGQQVNWETRKKVSPRRYFMELRASVRPLVLRIRIFSSTFPWKGRLPRLNRLRRSVGSGSTKAVATVAILLVMVLRSKSVGFFVLLVFKRAIMQSTLRRPTSSSGSAACKRSKTWTTDFTLVSDDPGPVPANRFSRLFFAFSHSIPPSPGRE